MLLDYIRKILIRCCSAVDNFPILAYDVDYGHNADSIRFRDGLALKQQRKSVALLIQVCHWIALLPTIDTEDFHTPALVFLKQLFEFGQRPDTRATPSSPEVHYDNSSAMIA